MKETIELIFRWLKAYVGTGWHWLLFLAAAVLLFFLREASKKRQILAGYCIGILFLYFFPLTAWIIMKACIGTDTYWRMFWLLPVTPVIAYVLVLAVCREARARRGYRRGCCLCASDRGDRFLRVRKRAVYNGKPVQTERRYDGCLQFP